MGIGECLGHLLKVKQCLVQANRSLAAERPQIAARHILEDKIVKGYAVEVGGSPVSEPLNNVRMPHPVQRNRFILKVLNQGLFQLRIGRSLKRGVESLDDDQPTFALLIVSKKYFGIASASQAALNQVTIVDYAVLES